MWFVGLLVGAVIGGIGDGGGVVIGGIVGVLLGAVIGSKLKRDAAADARMASLEGELKQLSERVDTLKSALNVALEGGARVATVQPAEMPVAPPVPEVPVSQPAGQALNTVRTAADPALPEAETGWADRKSTRLNSSH